MINNTIKHKRYKMFCDDQDKMETKIQGKSE